MVTLENITIKRSKNYIDYDDRDRKELFLSIDYNNLCPPE
jgi:hypothetical protein